MFTGIIEEVGVVREAGRGMLRIAATIVLEDARLGDSIAINGVDLTVAEMDGESFFANVMPETYRRSTLRDLMAGDRVNLERSLRATDRLSGHIVRGVVEGTGRLAALTPEVDAIIATYEAPPDLLRYMVVKGPVAIDGVSLTSSPRRRAPSGSRSCSTPRNTRTFLTAAPARKSTSRPTSWRAT